MRKFNSWAISLLLLFLFSMTFSPRNSPAHHTSSIAYIIQEVGKKKIGYVEIELNAMPPRLTKNNSTKAVQQVHKLLSRFTHRFELRASNMKNRNPITKKLDVKLKFTPTRMG